LPPIHAGDGVFTNLVRSDGTPLTDTFKAERTEALKAAFDDARPDVLILEAYPFARRAFRFELLPLLEAAIARAPRPLVLSSLRDILQPPSSQEKGQAALEIFERYFDGALVHGDPNAARIEESYPPLAAATAHCHYTGLVVPERTAMSSNGAPYYGVLVSAGGGAVGATLLKTAIKAKAQTSLADARWLVLTGPNLPPETDDRIRSHAAAAGVDVETFRSDLPALMANATLSIQQAGYNTVADLLQTDCRAVLVPYTEGGETEQATRAAFLADKGRAVVVNDADLSAGALASAIEAALQSTPSPMSLATDGARRSVELIEELFAKQRDDNSRQDA
ncbi:MAG: glycosyltransferase, partial [Pseudomonadota bacterium]